MYPYTFEFTDCQYCGEKIEAFQKRCPFCAGIQSRKKKESPETAAPGAESQPDTTPELAAQPEIIAGTGFVLINKDDAPSSGPTPIKEQKPIKPIGNGKKVLLTVLVTLIPVLGQLFGIVISAVYMSSSEQDKASFGNALFKASVTLSVLGFLASFLIIISLLT